MMQPAENRCGYHTIAAWKMMAMTDLGSFVHEVEADIRRLHARFMRVRDKLLAITNRMTAARSEAHVTRRGIVR